MTELREWREALWNEVHRIDGPRKSELVELGRKLDGIVDRVSGYGKALREADAHIGLEASDSTQAEIRRVIRSQLSTESNQSGSEG